jgi:hypothetical protein
VSIPAARDREGRTPHIKADPAIDAVERRKRRLLDALAIPVPLKMCSLSDIAGNP